MRRWPYAIPSPLRLLMGLPLLYRDAQMVHRQIRIVFLFLSCVRSHRARVIYHVAIGRHW